MPAYLVARVWVQDPQSYQHYSARSPGIIAKYGGRVLARGGTMEVLEGNDSECRVIIVEFPSLEAARGFYHSREYQEIREIRVPVAEAQFLIVEGAV